MFPNTLQEVGGKAEVERGEGVKNYAVRGRAGGLTRGLQVSIRKKVSRQLGRIHRRPKRGSRRESCARGFLRPKEDNSLSRLAQTPRDATKKVEFPGRGGGGEKKKKKVSD